MNLEHLCQTITKNSHRLRSVDFMWKFVRFHFELVAWKRQKLKLGAVLFEIKEIVYAEIVLHEEADIRYIRQDTSVEDSLKIENRLEAIKWRWDFKNIGAFLILFSLAYLYVRASFIIWYRTNLPSLAYKDDGILGLIRFTFMMLFVDSDLPSIKTFSFLNFLMANTLTDICIEFDFLT